MKKLLIVSVFLSLFLTGTFFVMAQSNEDEKTEVEETKEDTAQANADSAATDSAAMAEKEKAAKEKAEQEAKKATEDVAVEEPKESLHTVIKDKFIEGGPLFMSIVTTCLIFGLAIAVERIIALNLATTNVEKLLKNVRESLKSGGVEAARDLCAKTPGPVASIFSQGLLRSGEGAEAVEKSIETYGSVEMGKLEKGLTWVSLFISLAPMFGFMGTVIGMIDAFDTIEAAEDIKIDQVAGGIKTALLTTVAGLIVAVILQVFYNYCISKIDGIVNQMEEASISMVDLLIAEEVTKSKNQ